MNFWDFSGNYLIFIDFISLFKKAKKGVFSAGTIGKRGGGPAWIRHGMQGHVAEPSEPTRRLGGERWRERMVGPRRVHVDAWVAPRCSVRGLAGEGPMG